MDEVVEVGSGAPAREIVLERDGVPVHGALQHLVCELAKLPPVDCPLTHHFAHKVYGREMLIPAGTAVVGKVHKFSNLLVMMAGRATFRTPGEEPITVDAPHVWVSPPGAQRAVFAHTDCVFMAVHGTDKTDLEDIEVEFIAQNMLEYQQYCLTFAGQGEQK
jgi:hypothetical protein